MAYAKTRLFVNEIHSEIPEWAPVILDEMSLAFQIGVDNRVIHNMIAVHKRPPYEGETAQKGENPFYKKLHIPKKSGGTRIVHKVSDKFPERGPALYTLRALSTLLFSNVTWPQFIDAYVPGRSTLDSASKHAGHKTVLCYDIEDFFPSVTSAAIARALQKVFKYNGHVARTIAKMVTLERRLPQGSPVSPEFANLVAWTEFDEQIVHGLSGSDWIYSRYSDDIIISHPDDMPDNACDAVDVLVSVMLRNAGFRLNVPKIRRYGHGKGRIKRMEWLGFVINQKPNAPRETWRKLRQILYYCSCTGFAWQAQFHGEDTIKFKETLRGLLTHLKPVLGIKKSLHMEDYFRIAEAIDTVEQISNGEMK